MGILLLGGELRRGWALACSAAAKRCRESCAKPSRKTAALSTDRGWRGKMADVRNPARARLAGGEVSIGVGLRLARGVEIARIMQSCGWDWLFIDLEHGSMTLDTCSQISVAALDAGIAPIIRVPQGQLDMATRALDGGGWGIVMPHVDTAEEAAELAAHVKYPPQGHRSVMGALPQFGYRGIGVAETARIVNQQLLTTVMIETPKALENADKIAAVPGVDVLLIGTNDL